MTNISARTEILATHKWSEAPKHRAYLANLHAHKFIITAYAIVRTSDREIEFHDLYDLLNSTVRSIAENSDGTFTFGNMSCEQIGEKILQSMLKATSISVSEDGQFEAIVLRSNNRPPIITLCGSTRFKKEYEEAIAKLETSGWAVFSVGYFMHADGVETPEKLKLRFDALHKKKIEMSDAIYVVNPGGYIGESTNSEIEYARRLGKGILSLEEL